MSLSWDHAVAAKRPSRWPLVARIVGLLVVSLALADTGSALALPLNEIRGTFDQLTAAKRAHDIAGLRALYDPTRGVFTACSMDRYYAEVVEPRANGRYRVIRAMPYGDYVRAYVDDGVGIRRIYLRRLEGRWVLTEPRDDELGTVRHISDEKTRLTYWSIDEEVAGAVLRASSYAAYYAGPLAPDPIDDSLDVVLFPTRDTAASIPCGASGVARPVGQLEIRVLGPDLGFVGDSLGDITSSTRGLFVHEALHITQARVTPRAMTRPAWWLIEGWPTLVADGDARLGLEMPRIACGTLPTYSQLASGIGLTRDPSPDVLARYYVYAASAVKYLNESGNDAYWRSMRAYESPGTTDEVVQRAVGMTADQFRDGWAAWVKKRYCP